MEDKSLCPINSHPQSDGMCKKEKCAWWIDEKWGCIVQLIACSLSEIHKAVDRCGYR